MSIFKLNENSVERLHELADLMHPHLKGDNHTRTLIDKVYNGDKLCAVDAFDCGKYYDRMFEQLEKFKSNEELHTEYLHAILDFKWSIK